MRTRAILTHLDETRYQCRKCRRWLALDRFDTNPRTGRPFARCRRCRSVESVSISKAEL